jgi:hypothetical protein
MKPAVMFESIDHWAKKATPIMVNTDEIKSTNFSFSMPQIPSKAIIALVSKKKLRIFMVIRLRCKLK